MKVHLRTNVINDLIGTGVFVSLEENASLRALFDQLIRTYGMEIRERLLTKGRLNPHLTILVNGKPVSDANLESALPQSCEISIIQMLSGG